MRTFADFLGCTNFRLGRAMLALAGLLLAGEGILGGQTKDFVRFGNRVVVIESSESDLVVVQEFPTQQIVQGGSTTFRAETRAGQPASEVEWELQQEGTTIPPGSMLQALPGAGDSARKYTPGDTLTRIVRARRGGFGAWKTFSISVVTATATVDVAAVVGQTNQYQATADGVGAPQVVDANWAWGISPAGFGSLSAVGGNPRVQAYAAPATRYCDQTVVLSAVARNASLLPLGQGGLTVNVTKSTVASLPNAQAGFNTTVVSGSSVNLVATQPGFNCEQAESWSWSGTNVQQSGGAWVFQAPGGISSPTNYSITATESRSQKSTSFTVTVVPASAATVSVAPTPVSLPPYARVRLNAATSASSPSFSWGSTGGGALLTTSGSSVCFDAGPATSGTAQVTATMTSAQGGATGNAAIQFSTTGGYGQMPT